MKIAFDENMPIPLTRALQHLSIDAVHVTTIVGAGAEDLDWIAALGAHDIRFAITRDLNIKRRAHELRAMNAAGLGVFFLCGGEMSFREIARVLLNHWSDVERIGREWERPFCCQVRARGSPKRWRVPH